MKQRFLFSSVLAVLVLVAVASTASARSSVAVSGTYGVVDVYSQPTKVTPVGNSCRIEVDANYPFEGDLEGTAELHFWVLVHGPCESAAPFAYQENYIAGGTFEGTVLGEEGTLDLFYVGRGWPAEVGEQAVKSQIIIRSGTGKLAGAKGVLSVTYNMGDAFDTYEGRIRLK